MTKKTDIIYPQHCFCQIPDHELRPWAEKKYRDHLTTLELLTSTHDPHEKEIISIVAMLDIDEETMLKMMGNVDKTDHHIIHCRENIREMLRIPPEKEK